MISFIILFVNLLDLYDIFLHTSSWENQFCTPKCGNCLKKPVWLGFLCQHVPPYYQFKCFWSVQPTSTGNHQNTQTACREQDAIDTHHPMDTQVTADNPTQRASSYQLVRDTNFILAGPTDTLGKRGNALVGLDNIKLVGETNLLLAASD
jgi:hypothetical protein